MRIILWHFCIVFKIEKMPLDLSLIKRYFVISLLIVLRFTFAFCVSKFQITTLDGCAIIGFPNATINDCGYCVGGETNLDSDYGKDCKGVCFGDAVIDCRGVCGGNAYIDECSGICITAELSDNETNGFVNRDCRGLCIPPELSRPQQQAYDRDECGVCRLQSSDKSAFIDCSGECRLPGVEGPTQVCGQCVRKHEVNRLLNECGQCRSNKIDDSCACNDPNRCYAANSVTPRALPIGVRSKLLLLGYFHPMARDLHCLLQHESSGDIILFPVSFISKNKSAIECTVNLEKEGYYKIIIGFQRNSQNAFNANHSSLQLFAYNATKVFISDMQPKKLLTTDFERIINIKFTIGKNHFPELPLICKVRYGDNHEELTRADTQPFTCSLHPSNRRYESQTLTIIPTFDGNNSLSDGFELTIEEPFPRLLQQNSYISEDGLVIVIKFDAPVNIRSKTNTSITSCEYFLSSETIAELITYELENCLWATKDQLIIYTKQPLLTNKVVIKFNRNIIRVNDVNVNEPELKVTASRLTWSWSGHEPMLAVTGPSEVPICGSFALNGHFSSTKGSAGVYFSWDVIGEVNPELKEYVEENGKSTNLLLSSEFFEIHVPYKFIFKAYIADRDQTLEAGHTLIRLDYDSPIVSIYHTALFQLTPLHVNQEILFLADYSVPECVFPVQKVNIFWKVVDPRILFPLSNSKEDIAKRNSLTYQIRPFTVPVDQAVGIYLNANFGYRFNETSGAGFTFSAAKPPLIANIANGSHKITIGSNSGVLTISAANAQTEQMSGNLVYQWSCHDIKTAQPCYYNFGSTNSNQNKSDALLIDRFLQRQSILRLDSTTLEPNKNYAFGLQVFDANDHTSASQTEYTFVNVIDGNAPQVFVGPVYVKGKHLVSYDSQFNATFVVPAYTAITVKGRVIFDGDTSVRWQAINSIHRLNWSTKQLNGEIETELYIHENHIIPFGEYAFKLIACNKDKLCSEADISLIAPQGVTNCNVSVEPFIEYESAFANIQECNTPPGYAPLTYQLYLAEQSQHYLIPLTAPQYSSVITFSAPTISALNSSVRIAAQVCSKFDVCHLFYSKFITIKKVYNESYALSELLKTAKRYNTGGDAITALSVLGNALINLNTTQFRLSEKVINDTVKYSTVILTKPSQVLSDGHLAVAYNVLSSALKISNNTLIKRQLLTNINKFTQKSFGLKTMPKLDTIKHIYSNLMLYFRRTKSNKVNDTLVDSELLRDLRKAFVELRRVAAAQTQFGTELLLQSHYESDGIQLHNSVTKLVHSDHIDTIKLSARLDKDTTVRANVIFGDEVKSLYRNGWQCGQQMVCQSVVFSLTIYPEENPYPHLNESFRLTPTLDVTIHAPNTGEEQTIKGFFQAAIFKATLIGNESSGGPDFQTICFYYDEEDQTWKKDDVHPIGIAYRNVGCLTGHLTAFVVLRVLIGVSSAYVVGIVVAVVMGILVFAIMVALFVQRKKDDNSAKVSPQTTSVPPKPMLNASKARNRGPKLHREHHIHTNSAPQTILISD